MAGSGRKREEGGCSALGLLFSGHRSCWVTLLSVRWNAAIEDAGIYPSTVLEPSRIGPGFWTFRKMICYTGASLTVKLLYKVVASAQNGSFRKYAPAQGGLIGSLLVSDIRPPPNPKLRASNIFKCHVQSFPFIRCQKPPIITIASQIAPPPISIHRNRASRRAFTMPHGALLLHPRPHYFRST